jgi:hypothetical protein
MSGLGLLLAAFFSVLGEVDVNADPPVAEVKSTSVECKPFNLATADAGFSNITCAAGFRAVTIETEATTATYICGQGATLANYQTVCRKRCVGCNNGSQISDDVNMVLGGAYNLRCVSATADAGTVFAVTCGK